MEEETCFGPIILVECGKQARNQGLALENAVAVGEQVHAKTVMLRKLKQCDDPSPFFGVPL